MSEVTQTNETTTNGLAYDTHPVFGKIPHGLIDTVDLKRTLVLSQEIFQEKQKWIGAQEVAKKDDRLRMEIGALHFQIVRDLLSDIRRSGKVLESLWSCLWASLARSDLRPQKWYNVCASSDEGYACLVTILANKDSFDRWGFSSQADFARRVSESQGLLIEKEREYRNAATAITQIGIGFGGMVLGLLGFALALALFIIQSIA